VQKTNAVLRVVPVCVGYNALGTLLEANRNVVEDAEWPFIADEFVERIIREHVSKSESPELYALIARAFGDPSEGNLW